ncbi:hypothetical protein LJR016_002336 [Devosia sp. LjRoot16]|uniref:hypothetical protein n=1 Tax=Devosia sp. LjRoot16 TaxID=3342271 RepID=UPI003ECE5E96
MQTFSSSDLIRGSKARPTGELELQPFDERVKFGVDSALTGRAADNSLPRHDDCTFAAG